MIDLVDRLLYTLAQIAGRVMVAQLGPLMFAGGSTGGSTGASEASVVEDDDRLHSGISTGIQNFPGFDRLNLTFGFEHRTILSLYV